jgi:hypothetical protein
VANKKISELPTGTIAGTDTVPVVKVGVTTAVPFSHTHAESEVTSLVTDLAALDTRIDALEAATSTRLFENLTTVGNIANQTEQELHVFTVPAGTLVADGDALHLRSWVQCAANANSKVVKVRFGGSVLATTTGANFNNVAFVIDVWVFRTGAATQKAIGTGVQPNVEASWAVAAGGGFNVTTPGETLSGTVSMRVTGQSTVAGTADDIRVLATVIDYLPAA